METMRSRFRLTTLIFLTMFLLFGRTGRANVQSTLNWTTPAWSVWVDNAGNVTVANDNIIQRLNASGGVTWTVTLPSNDGFDFSNRAVFDASNNLYVDGFNDDRSAAASVTVVKISPSGVTQWHLKYAVGAVNASEHMAAGPMLIAPNGNLYVLGREGQASTPSLCSETP